MSHGSLTNRGNNPGLAGKVEFPVLGGWAGYDGSGVANLMVQ